MSYGAVFYVSANVSRETFMRPASSCAKAQSIV